MNNKEKEREILSKIHKFDVVVTTNPCYDSRYYHEDYMQLIKELEEEYDCKIDSISLDIDFN